MQDEKGEMNISHFESDGSVHVVKVIRRRLQVYTKSILKLLRQRESLFQRVKNSGSSVSTDIRCSKHDQNIAATLQYMLQDSSVQQSSKREIASWVQRAVKDSPSSYPLDPLLQALFSESVSNRSNPKVEEMESTVVTVRLK